jgi:tellurite resistance protein TerC
MRESIIAGAFVVIQLIFLEGILSLDNAAVLGAMVAPLPDDRPIPWPARLAALGHGLARSLGPQRTAALRVGLLGAYAGRTLMLILAAWVMRSPWLMFVGALYLVFLAIRHLGGTDEGRSSGSVDTHRSFWRVVIAVELADLAFSLDNVVAATALSKDLPLVILGVALGILMMRFAAGIFAGLVRREPILENAAYVLVLILGIELLLQGALKVEIGDLAKFAISAATLVLAIAYARLDALHVFAPLLGVAQKGLRRLNELIYWLMTPFRMLISASARLVQRELDRPLGSLRKASGHHPHKPE